MRTVFLFLLSLLVFSVSSHSAAAQNGYPEENLVKIRLLAEQNTIMPGEEIWIGIEKSIAPHWHTYWENPGDSGVPLRAKWALPEGFKIGDIKWPAPDKIPYEPLLNYGYEGNVILLQKLTAPENMSQEPIELTADIELLVCKEECIPEYGTYTLTLNAKGIMPENNSPYLSAALKKVPSETDWPITYSENKNDFILNIGAPDEDLKNIKVDTIEFFPLDWGFISNPEQPRIEINDKTLNFYQARGERALSEVESIPGVLSYETAQKEKKSISFTAIPAPAPVQNEQPQTNEAQATNLTLLSALLFALIGGMILNLMPCVFPVLSLKALSLIKTAEKDPMIARMHGLSYTAGVVLSFLLIAAALLSLKAAGSEIGWGFHLQSPLVVGSLVYLLFVIGLNLMGVFELSNPFGNVGSKLTQNDGMSGSFFTGILATLVATPCTAPFMAGALGFALVQPAFISLLVFAALGLGLALPYLALSFIPALQARMPRPGAWMDTFKQLLAFPMFGAAIWLIWVLGEQIGTNGITNILIGLGMISFAIWLIKHRPENTVLRNIIRIVVIGCLLIAALAVPNGSGVDRALSTSTSQNEKFGDVFSQERLDELLKQDDPVFVEMTAAWCITCKVNHAVAINTRSTKALFAENNVDYLIGDWTNQDPKITQYLSAYGRNGVPLYVYYGPRDAETGERPKGAVLPQILTPAIVKDYIVEN